MDIDEWLDILNSLPAYRGYQTGGRVPLGGGKLAKEGLPAAIAYLKKKFGKDIIKKGSELKRPESALKREMFQNFNKELNAPKIWENPDKVRAAVDDIFSTGDYKMDAEMAAEALVENNPAAFGGKLIDDIDDATRSDIYGAVLKVVQSDLAKMLQLKRLSKPTKTLESIKKTGKINISEEGVADEFTRFMKETDPKGFKDLEQKVELSNLDIKGKKGHATGGRVPMFGGGSAWKAWKAFINGFFLKTSNEMRQGKGIWKDLTPEQMWKQHDNLTKKSVEWRLNNYKKLPGGMKEYFGMNDIQLVNAFKKAQAKVKAQKYADEMDAEMWDAGRDAVDSLTGKKEVLKRVKMGDKAAIKEKIKRDERAMIKQKYQGKIDDKLLNQILVDDNPARIAEVTATIDEALIMQHKGMGPETIMQTFKDAWKRKKQASGGLAGMLGE